MSAKRWAQLCRGDSGNAQHARNCRDTPLESEAILDLVWGNISYFNDSYYNVLVEPIEMRVSEFYTSIGKAEP